MKQSTYNVKGDNEAVWKDLDTVGKAVKAATCFRYSVQGLRDKSYTVHETEEWVNNALNYIFEFLEKHSLKNIFHWSYY